MSHRNFYKIQVLATDHPIPNAKSVQFAIPETLAQIFHWRAGQHITLRFHLGGEEVRRSYTISSSPETGEPLRITVKRVNGGLVSNHIIYKIVAGDVVELMPPFGSFTLEPDLKKRRTHYFFGAGSGITPLFAMINSVLKAEPHSFAHLLYGNGDENSIIFREALTQLVANSNGRLTVCHILSNQGWMSRFQAWKNGRVDSDSIKAFIDENRPIAQDTQYYVCGPGGMNKAVKQALANLDVPLNRMHSESFGGEIELDQSFDGIASDAVVTLNGQNHPIKIKKKQTVLKAMLTADLKPPYSCQSGVCGACRATLKNGEIHLRARMALDDAEIAQGAILTCQAVAKSKDLTIQFD